MLIFPFNAQWHLLTFVLNHKQIFYPDSDGCVEIPVGDNMKFVGASIKEKLRNVERDECMIDLGRFQLTSNNSVIGSCAFVNDQHAIQYHLGTVIYER